MRKPSSTHLGIFVATAATLTGALIAPAQAADPEQQGTGARSAIPSVQAGGTTARSTARASRDEAHARIASVIPTRIPRLKPRLGKNFGISVTDAATNERVYQRRGARSFLPASNMKILTAATALRVLGPDTKFTTNVKVVGQGAITIVGAGDPTMSDDQFKSLAQQIKAAQATNPLLVPVPGQQMQVYYDKSLFGYSARKGWPASYTPGIVRPTEALGRYGRYVREPARDATDYFVSRLAANGISARRAGNVNAPSDAAIVASTTGMSVAEQVKVMLQVSENNIAEELFVHAGLIATGRGIWQGGRAAAFQTLATYGVGAGGWRITSGSGVGRRDLVVPNGMTTLLGAIADQNRTELNAIYYGGGLPLSARSGTLGPGTGRFTSGPSRCAAGLIRAKTGTLHDVVALSGLTTGTDGRLKAFSIVVNNRPERKFTPLQTRRAVDVLAATVNGCH